MEVKVMRITPPVAREWLKRNVLNRPLRSSVVDALKTAFLRGEYKVTHQGIAFDQDGNLLDGQHRLTAIGMMPENFSIEMLVARGLSCDAFQAIDIGLKRSAGDVLNVPQGLAAISRFMAAIVETQKNAITPQLLVPYVAGLERPYRRLVDYTPTVNKTWSSAAVRSAAVLRMLEGGDLDYIQISYHALNHSEFDAMAPVVQALYRQQVKGLVRAGGLDIFARAFRAFDARRQGMDRIQITDSSVFLSDTRDLIYRVVLGQKKAALNGAAKKVNAVKSTKAHA